MLGIVGVSLVAGVELIFMFGQDNVCGIFCR